MCWRPTAGNGSISHDVAASVMFTCSGVLAAGTDRGPDAGQGKQSLWHPAECSGGGPQEDLQGG